MKTRFRAMVLDAIPVDTCMNAPLHLPGYPSDKYLAAAGADSTGILVEQILHDPLENENTSKPLPAGVVFTCPCQNITFSSQTCCLFLRIRMITMLIGPEDQEVQALTPLPQYLGILLHGLF